MRLTGTRTHRRCPAKALPPAQPHALAYLPGDLSNISCSVYGVFYGFGFICEAYLVYKSTFVPRAIGVLLAIDALNYLSVGFTTMLAPPAHDRGPDARGGAYPGGECVELLPYGARARRTAFVGRAGVENQINP